MYWFCFLFSFVLILELTTLYFLFFFWLCVASNRLIKMENHSYLPMKSSPCVSNEYITFVQQKYKSRLNATVCTIILQGGFLIVFLFFLLLFSLRFRSISLHRYIPPPPPLSPQPDGTHKINCIYPKKTRSIQFIFSDFYRNYRGRRGGRF